MSIRKISEAEIKREFGEGMRELRKRKGLSQERLALDVEMDLTSINEIEKGHRSPKLITVYKIAQALGVPMKELADL